MTVQDEPEFTIANLSKAIGCKALSLMEAFQSGVPTLSQRMTVDDIATIMAHLHGHYVQNTSTFATLAHELAEILQSRIGASRDTSGLRKADKVLWDKCQAVIDATRQSTSEVVASSQMVTVTQEQRDAILARIAAVYDERIAKWEGLEDADRVTDLKASCFEATALLTAILDAMMRSPTPIAQQLPEPSLVSAAEQVVQADRDQTLTTKHIDYLAALCKDERTRLANGAPAGMFLLPVELEDPEVDAAADLGVDRPTVVAVVRAVRDSWVERQRRAQ